MQIKNINAHVEELLRVHDYYRVTINNNMGRPVLVTQTDYFYMLNLIGQLHNEINEFNPTISNELNDIYQYLFDKQGVINPYRFGVLGFLLRYNQHFSLSNRQPPRYSDLKSYR